MNRRKIRRYFQLIAAAPVLCASPLLVACLGGTVPLDDPAAAVTLPMSARPGLATLRSGALEAVAHLKVPHAEASALFGAAVALSGDGSTLAVGADLKSLGRGGWFASSGGDVPRAGAVYLYARTPQGWEPQAQLVAQFPVAGAGFGFSLALSNDGRTLAVGAPFEVESADAGAEDVASGAVHVFRREGRHWLAQSRLAAPAGASGFGSAVSMAGQGDLLAVAMLRPQGRVGARADTRQGPVHVFGLDGTAWSHRAELQPAEATLSGGFGASVALSADGGTIAIGAPEAPRAAVHLFRRDGEGWRAGEQVLADPGSARQGFGARLGLSADGDTLVVGAPGVSAREGATPAAPGATYVYARQAGSWRQQALLRAPHSAPGDGFGGQLALSADARVLAVGAQRGAGAVHLFAHDTASWRPRRPLTFDHADGGHPFGAAIALSGDGRTLAVGDRLEHGGATGSQQRHSGAVRLYAAR
ncbi:hypothetical protein [Hydrogenophaga sp.]|uniref:hypothetical protein n=1 Tax=Hydrogenophaga sp. TaxID=1904254 RepID=UPI003D0BB2C4